MQCELVTQCISETTHVVKVDSNNQNNHLVASYDHLARKMDWAYSRQPPVPTCTPCLKKLCQLIFCSMSVKYEPISINIVSIVPEETLSKTVPKMPTSPKVCACTTLGNLKCQI